ncbi:hypothetical protein AGOR_G00187650 [Albula goreensis]|uniref:G-protein coupled receptors family 1 profile domain-containing protein n=1 Tax=Albula goreensis TaxID=1534307 RepID=A0A8T3CYB9_9TELE|nr:hypothetical protein AGOR_G00187650 [Albula goreensis]
MERETGEILSDSSDRLKEELKTESYQAAAASSMFNSSLAPVPALATKGSAPSLPVSHQIGISILVLAFVLGFPGNLFVVWTVLCRVSRRSVTCLLVLNLALADALVLLSAPLFLRFLAGGRGWEFGSGVCKTVHYLCCVNMYASIYLICLMSVDRWLAVTRPFLSQRLRTKRTLWGLLLGLWTLAFLLAVPMPFYRSNLKILVGRNVSVYVCMPHHWGSVGHQVFQYLMETILGFLLPFILIIFCYCSVICRLRSAMFQRRGQGSRLILLIIAAFIVFWLPYHTINILQVVGLVKGGGSVLKVALGARPNVTAFAFFSSSINPILYVFAGSSHIRRAGLGFMAKLFEGTNSESGSFSRATSRSGSTTETSTLHKLSVRFGRRATREEGDGETIRGPAPAELKTLPTAALC